MPRKLNIVQDFIKSFEAETKRQKLGKKDADDLKAQLEDAYKAALSPEDGAKPRWMVNNGTESNG